eukprot:scaffold3765_cov122-Isochrysis_galbana.AAC.8
MQVKFLKVGVVGQAGSIWQGVHEHLQSGHICTAPHKLLLFDAVGLLAARQFSEGPVQQGDAVTSNDAHATAASRTVRHHSVQRLSAGLSALRGDRSTLGFTCIRYKDRHTTYICRAPVKTPFHQKAPPPQITTQHTHHSLFLGPRPVLSYTAVGLVPPGALFTTPLSF